jgi:hypothetical protein
MPSTNVTPASDVTTTGWSNSGSGSYAATLAASSGAGDGTHVIKISTGGTDAFVLLATTFSTAGFSAITGATCTVAWKDDSKSGTGDFLIELWDSTSTTKIAHMASAITSTSNSEITSGPTALTVDNATLSNWANFRIKLFSEVNGGDATGDFYGLTITVTYATTAGAIYSESGVTGGSVQTSGLVGLTPGFIVGHATIGSRNFW